MTPQRAQEIYSSLPVGTTLTDFNGDLWVFLGFVPNTVGFIMCFARAVASYPYPGPQTVRTYFAAYSAAVENKFPGIKKGITVQTLGESYPKEQERVRTILGYYKEIGPSGQFGAMMIEDLLRRADVAAIQQDLPRMIQIYEEMKLVKE